MSPLTIKKIKDAGGNVKIMESIHGWAIKILDGGAWITIYNNSNRKICEQIVQKANGRVILG